MLSWWFHWKGLVLLDRIQVILVECSEAELVPAALTLQVKLILYLSEASAFLIKCSLKLCQQHWYWRQFLVC